MNKKLLFVLVLITTSLLFGCVTQEESIFENDDLLVGMEDSSELEIKNQEIISQNNEMNTMPREDNTNELNNNESIVFPITQEDITISNVEKFNSIIPKITAVTINCENNLDCLINAVKEEKQAKAIIKSAIVEGNYTFENKNYLEFRLENQLFVLYRVMLFGELNYGGSCELKNKN